MTDLEKAVRYLCLFETDDTEAIIERYKTIDSMVHGDEELIARYVSKYESAMSMLFKLMN